VDQGCHLASESTLFRVFMNTIRRYTSEAVKKGLNVNAWRAHKAPQADCLWSWVISWLAAPPRGTWFYLYLMMGVYSRKIIGHEVYEN
jgi:putative transposase